MPDQPSSRVLQGATSPPWHDMVAALTHPADSGHYDELRASATPANTSPWSAPWQTFFSHMGSQGLQELNQRSQTLARQVRDNGITYNVYADRDGPQRPWALDLFPLILDAASWQALSQGIVQRAELLERILQDVYGPQQLIREAYIPPALVQGHVGYLRAMHGVTPVGGAHLHIAAFDLARGPDGQWAVVSQRTQAPSGLGYLLENRVLISRQFPQAFEAMQVQRLAASYRQWLASLKAMSPAGAQAHVALLTPGPYNETYFEHAYLARYLGLTLVEGHDLTVRHERLYLRTLRGLEPVHVLLKRMDDAFLDPLELRADSTLGVAGLLQAVRAGHVVVANTPGSAFLESPALLGFLPALSEKLLGQTLQLPSLDTWWCGEPAALQAAVAEVAHTVIKPTYPEWVSQGGFQATLGTSLSAAQRDEWMGRIAREPQRYTLQAYQPLSQLPTWDAAQQALVPRSVVLRVFALRDGTTGWHVLPGGLARIAPDAGGIASMQRGGSSADVWVCGLATGNAVPEEAQRTDEQRVDARLADAKESDVQASDAAVTTTRLRLVTSRSAENLYWLGRYTERSENTVRLARLCLEVLHAEEPASATLWSWLQALCVQQNMVPAGVPAAPDKGSLQASQRRLFERTLVANLDADIHATSVGYNLRCLQRAASSLRERLSPEHWHAIVHGVEQFSQDCQTSQQQPDFSTVQAMQALDAANTALAAITGAQTDRMTRDDGWQLLSIGRHVERLGFLASALSAAWQAGALTPRADTHAQFAAMLALFDSTITFHAQFQQSRALRDLLELLVLDADNPRALAWVARSLRARLNKLADAPRDKPELQDVLARQVPDLNRFNLDALCATSTDNANSSAHALTQLLQQCAECAWQISDALTARYFSHTESADSVGA
jgi:uncharacterized circularly permuted ATP-grasp superfamily protein/uncharacterized alpha-E superfamily protein